MIDIEEMSQRILSELEEAWAENVVSTLNTVIKPQGNQEELARYLESLRRLVQAKLVVMATETGTIYSLEELDVENSLRLIDSMHSEMAYNKAESIWNGLDKFNYPHIVATDTGHARAQEILENEAINGGDKETKLVRDFSVGEILKT